MRSDCAAACRFDLACGVEVGGRPGGAQTVFVRDGVSIRPAAREVLGGRLSILRQRRSLFLTWLPHNPGSLQEDGSFQPSPDAARSPELARSVGAP